MLRPQAKGSLLPKTNEVQYLDRRKRETGGGVGGTFFVAFISALFGALIMAAITTFSESNDANLQQEYAVSQCTSSLPVLKEDGWKPVHVYYGDTNIVTDQIPSEWRLIDVEKNLAGDKWFGQHGQDVAVAKFFNFKKNGFFIDLAANDAVWASNTFALEHNFGWNGICIEPNPYYWYRLANRKCHAVGSLVGGKNKEELKVHFEMTKVAGPYGGIVGDNFDNNKDRKDDERRYAASLLSVLEMFDAPTIIDFISLDVEGAEQYIMRDFPFDKYKFLAMTIERPKEELRTLLEANGYKHLYDFHRGDTLWAHSSVYEEGKSRLEIDPQDIDNHSVKNLPSN